MKIELKKESGDVMFSLLLYGSALHADSRAYLRTLSSISVEQSVFLRLGDAAVHAVCVHAYILHCHYWYRWGAAALSPHSCSGHLMDLFPRVIVSMVYIMCNAFHMMYNMLTIHV